MFIPRAKFSKPVFVGSITNVPDPGSLTLEHPLEHLYIDALKYKMEVAVTDILDDGTYVVEARIRNVDEKNWYNRYILAPRENR